MVIHHTLSFGVVINIVMPWTFTMKLPGGWDGSSLQGGSGYSTRESTEKRLSAAAAVSLTSLAINLHLLLTLIPPSGGADLYIQRPF